MQPWWACNTFFMNYTSHICLWILYRVTCKWSFHLVHFWFTPWLILYIFRNIILSLQQIHKIHKMALMYSPTGSYRPYRPMFSTEQFQTRSPFHFKSIFISDKCLCWDKEIHTCRPCLWPIKRSLIKFSQNKCDSWNELKRHSMPNMRPFHLKRIRLENHFSSFKKAVPLFQLP